LDGLKEPRVERTRPFQMAHCCAGAESVCMLPRDSGPCRGSFTKYFYDYRTRRCRIFTYGGCEGNANNFDTADQCRQMCIGGKMERSASARG